MSYGEQTRNPHLDDHSPEDHDNGEFDCPCGADHCRGYQDDPNLIRLFGKFYASDCVMASHHPEIVRERELASRDDVYRDDMRRSGR